MNESIRAARVLVIDADGTRAGEFTLSAALSRARDANLDLVEVDAGAIPPVCRIQDHAKAECRAAVAARHARRAQTARATEQREIKLRPGIGEHDYQVKLRKITELLGGGARVRVVVQLRGRLQHRPELAQTVTERLIDDLGDTARAEPTRKSGTQVVTVFIPLSKRRAAR